MVVPNAHMVAEESIGCVTRVTSVFRFRQLLSGCSFSIDASCPLAFAQPPLTFGVFAPVRLEH